MCSRAALARTLPFAIYMGFLVIGDLLARCGVSAELLRLLYPLKIGAVLLCLVVFWGRYHELQTWRLNRRTVLLGVGAGVLVLGLWIQLNARWMVIGQPVGYDPSTDGRLMWPLLLVRWAGGALVVPLMEELFWRSFLMRWLEAPQFEAVVPARINYRSFIITVILFGAEHNLWLAGMVAGVVYGYLYRRSGNLWLSILAHGVTNGALGLWIIVTGSWSYW